MMIVSKDSTSTCEKSESLGDIDDELPLP